MSEPDRGATARLPLALPPGRSGPLASRRYDQAVVPDRLYFTDSDEANELIASDPLALLIGFALDQQVTVQQAFIGPLRLGDRADMRTGCILPTR